MLWWVFVLVTVLALGFTGLVYRYAVKYRLLDIPGTRSSHQQPTPRGGGLAIVLALVAGAILLVGQGRLEPDFLALLGPGLLLALIGLADDRFHLAFAWRLLGQAAVAAACLWLLEGVPWLTLPLVDIQVYYLADILMLIFFVWYLNLYNFMDGINGIASLQAITVCLGGLLVLLSGGMAGEPVTLLVGLMLAACIGFLPWNFPRARIFMGDVGSLFCGYALMLAMLLAGRLNPELFWALLTLTGVFVVDATFTLLRRLCRGEKVWQAHRSHAYQRIARRWGSHTPVSLVVVAINLCWLLPVALLITTGALAGVAGLLLAYAPLAMLAWLAGAGKAT